MYQTKFLITYFYLLYIFFYIFLEVLMVKQLVCHIDFCSKSKHCKLIQAGFDENKMYLIYSLDFYLALSDLNSWWCATV